MSSASSSTRRVEGRVFAARHSTHCRWPRSFGVIFVVGMLPALTRAPGASSSSADAPLPLMAALGREDPSSINPVSSGISLVATDNTVLDDVQCDSLEQRCYLITNKDHIARLLPAAIVRDRENPLLIEWSFLKLLPPDWYVIVFATNAGRYKRVPDAKLRLDGYPPVPRSPTDPERMAGFSDYKKLRLVLYPPAWRFFRLEMHVPLVQPGVWPTTREVQYTGYRICASWYLGGPGPGEFRGDSTNPQHVACAQLSAKVDAACPTDRCAVTREWLQGHTGHYSRDDVALPEEAWLGTGPAENCWVCGCFVAALKWRFDMQVRFQWPADRGYEGMCQVGDWASCVSSHMEYAQKTVDEGCALHRSGWFESDYRRHTAERPAWYEPGLHSGQHTFSPEGVGGCYTAESGFLAKAAFSLGCDLR